MKLSDLTAIEQEMLAAFINEGRECNNSDTPEALCEDNMTWMSASDLRKALGWSPQKVGGVMSALQDKGLILDSGESARGARDTDWTATDAGIRLGWPLTE